MNGIDWSPVWISMKVAGITMLITFFLGLGAAWFVCRRKKEISKAVWDGIFTMPLVLPPTVVGFVLLYLFGVNGPAGKFFLHRSHRRLYNHICKALFYSLLSLPIRSKWNHQN